MGSNPTRVICLRFLHSIYTVLTKLYFKTGFEAFDLKALDTFGNCQRPVFLRGGSQHAYSIGRRSCEMIMEE